MKTLIEKIRTYVERHAEIKQMASELSELDPRELEAIVGIAPRDIDNYCRTAVAETRLRQEASAAAERVLPKAVVHSGLSGCDRNRSFAKVCPWARAKPSRVPSATAAMGNGGSPSELAHSE